MDHINLNQQQCDFSFLTDATVIKSITSPVKADKGGTAHFECVADANPQIDNMVRWSREDYDMTKTKQRYENGKSFLTVLQLEKTDRGKFKCTASNGIGKPVSKEAMLIVKCEYTPIADGKSSVCDRGRCCIV